eukprot:4674903-Pyramimonas_sp.AAC.1
MILCRRHSESSSARRTLLSTCPPRRPIQLEVLNRAHEECNARLEVLDVWPRVGWRPLPRDALRELEVVDVLLEGLVMFANSVYLLSLHASAVDDILFLPRPAIFSSLVFSAPDDRTSLSATALLLAAVA